MTMTFSLHENFSFGGDSESSYEITSVSSTARQPAKTNNIHLFTDKLTVPKFKNYIKRPRLNEMLKKSLNQFGATLITGRAGTGKSALAANFVRQYEQSVWLSVEATDCDWNIFSSYFHSLFVNLDYKNKLESKNKNEKLNTAKNEISPFVESLFSNLRLKTEKPVLIVIDDIHNVFDADWFAEFFSTLLYSLEPNIQLLMLSRSNPPLPLWRLRSKQVLGIIDEKLLAFNLEETKEFFNYCGSSVETAVQAYDKSFGRVSRLRKLAESI